jgi:hypothetical protein
MVVSKLAATRVFAAMIANHQRVGPKILRCTHRRLLIPKKVSNWPQAPRPVDVTGSRGKLFPITDGAARQWTCSP